MNKHTTPSFNLPYMGAFVLACLIGLLVAYWAYEDFMLNANIGTQISVIFSLLAASSFSVAAILASPSMLIGKNWRENGAMMQYNLGKILKLFWYFAFCILVLIFSIVGEIVRPLPDAENGYLTVFYYLYAYLTFIGVYFAFPTALMLVQYFHERLELEVEHMRKRDIKNNWG